MRSIFSKAKRAWHSFAASVELRPEEIGLSFALVFFGSRALITGLQTAPGSVQSLPLWLAVTYCLLSCVGGLAVLFGVFCRMNWTWAYGVELFGLCVSASAWASYILGLLLSPITGKSTLLILALLALVLSSGIRAHKIRKDSKAQLVALRIAKSEQEG
jgi:hypothetical protein